MMSESTYKGYEEYFAQFLLRALQILVLLVACASLTWPFGSDQGIFAWIGDIINRGGLTYRDGWDIKGPLGYYVYAFAQWLFGPRVWSIRLLDMMLLAAACLALHSTARSWTDRSIATWVVLLFFLWYVSGSYWHTAQPDGWVMMLMIPVAAMLLQPDRKIRWIDWWFASILIGCTLLVKFFYGCFMLVPILRAIGVNGHPIVRAKIILVSIAGLILPMALAVIWFWRQGALDTFIEATLHYPADTYAKLVWDDSELRLRGLVDYLSCGIGIGVALPFCVVWSVCRRNQVACAGRRFVGLDRGRHRHCHDSEPVFHLSMDAFVSRGGNQHSDRNPCPA